MFTKTFFSYQINITSFHLELFQFDFDFFLIFCGAFVDNTSREASSWVTGTSWLGPSTPWFGIMSEGHIPGLIVRWIASASLSVLKNNDGSHRPVAVGVSLRRLTVKSFLATVSKDMAR